MSPIEAEFVDNTMARSEALLAATTLASVGILGASEAEESAFRQGGRFMTMGFVMAHILASRPACTTSAEVRAEVTAHLAQRHAETATMEAVH